MELVPLLVVVVVVVCVCNCAPRWQYSAEILYRADDRHEEETLCLIKKCFLQPVHWIYGGFKV